MKKKLIPILFLVLMPTLISATQRQTLVPVSDHCILKAAQVFDVPEALLMAVMVTEGGKVGEYRINRNKTRDNGPMQINSVWMSELKKQGIEETELQNNGCLNIFIGAYILSKHLAACKEPWTAVGLYHSKTRELAQQYRQKVYENLFWLIKNGNLDHAIKRININVGK
ncbi:MAG: lytic transglycosylase domain-containing protein [Desulfobacteraceae bacterium]|nr:lytic transglycosylase domain-containing protein [Desulfobacteraceae bacterium]